MKHLKLFENTQSYDNFKNGDDFILPNVSYILEGSKLFYNPYLDLRNGTIYATFNATSDNMVAIYDMSNVKSLIVDDKEISFDITESSTIINIIGENITMNDDMQSGTFPEEYCYMLSNGLPSSWTFKPTNASIDECNYIALIGIVGGQMMVSPMPINTGIEQGFFTYDDINNVFCVSESLLGEMSQGGIGGLNFVCVKMDEVNGTFTFLDTTHDIKFRSGGKPIRYIFDSEGNHTMEIELIDDTGIPQKMFYSANDYTGSCISTIKIPDSVTSIYIRAFQNCSSLTAVTIPNSVTSIGDLAFYNCSSLTSITIPDYVNTLGPSAFNGCTSLTSITIPNSVISIGENTFKGCTSLTSVTIGNSVVFINKNAFKDCSSLNEITCLSAKPPRIYSYTFTNIKTDGILHIPAGSDYSSWMSTDEYYLGYYNWTVQEI